MLVVICTKCRCNRLLACRVSCAVIPSTSQHAATGWQPFVQLAQDDRNETNFLNQNFSARLTVYLCQRCWAIISRLDSSSPAFIITHYQTAPPFSSMVLAIIGITASAGKIPATLVAFAWKTRNLLPTRIEVEVCLRKRRTKIQKS